MAVRIAKVTSRRGVGMMTIRVYANARVPTLILAQTTCAFVSVSATVDGGVV